jgi:hypothetical protein
VVAIDGEMTGLASRARAGRLNGRYPCDSAVANDGAGNKVAVKVAVAK